MISIQTKPNTKVYFASDQHLGAPTQEESIPRERKFLRWLDAIKKDAEAIFLLGDLFDFWFEYKAVVPKGFVRILGKLAEIRDSGIPIYFFVGNHDMWMIDYFETELNIPVYYEPQVFEINNKTYFLGHGDGLGPYDNGYKRIKKIFRWSFFNWCYRWLHPDLGMRLGQYMSVRNKTISGDEDFKFLGDDEWLVLYCKRKLETQHYDYFMFGHRHLPLEIQLNSKSKYINTGDWVSYFTYATVDENGVKLLEFS